MRYCFVKMRFSLEQLAIKASGLAILLLQGAQKVDGHYGFPVLIVNGVASEWWEFTRPIGLDVYGGQFFPSYDWTGPNQICGVNATKTGHQTNTAKAEAGSIIGFRPAPATYSSGIIPPHPFNPQEDVVGHQGPGQAYMSLAPGALEDYEGDGEWFKIGTSGSSDGMYWDSNGKTEINFTIPLTTPPGKYLIRIEHFNISPYYNGTQQFINCAHVEVSGPGGGTPGPTTKFPGAYDIADKGIQIPRAMYNPYKPTDLLKNYKGPGPEIWKG